MKPAQINKIRDSLKSHLEDNPEYSMNGIARSINRSPATLSLFLSGKYSGDNSKVAIEVAGYLARDKEKAEFPSFNFEFVETRNAKRIFEVANICHLQGEIGVVYGEAGLGKTAAAKEYASRHLTVILIEVDPSYSARALIKQIHRSLGGDGKGGIFELFESIVRQLHGTGRMIIIDQAELLPHRALELLRSINDKAGTGILMLGMHALRNNIVGLQGEFAQLYSRVGVAIKLQAWTKDDVKAVVHQAIPGSNGLADHFYSQTNNGRKLNKLLKRAIMVARNNDMDVTTAVVDKASELLIV